MLSKSGLQHLYNWRYSQYLRGEALRPIPTLSLLQVFRSFYRSDLICAEVQTGQFQTSSNVLLGAIQVRLPVITRWDPPDVAEIFSPLELNRNSHTPNGTGFSRREDGRYPKGIQFGLSY